MSRLKYTTEHLEFLRSGYQSINTCDLTKVFNERFGLEKTETAIRSALKNYNIKCGRAPKDRFINRIRLFTAEQKSFVRTEYKNSSLADLVRVFNDRFGTTRTRKQMRCFVKNHGIISGRTGFYEKGHEPWNVGTKGHGLTGPNKSSFKNGHVPANIKPIGSERTTRDGFIEIKVAEYNPYTGFPTRYKHKHIHVYEQKNGPVPKGMVVAFRDSDKTNCEPENLMLISRAELLMLNRHGYKEMPAELKPSVLALSKLKVKARAVEKEVTA